MADLKFDPRDLSGNALKLVEFFDLASEADIPMASFSIDGHCGGYTAGAVPGKYKTALLLLYLSTLTIDGVGRDSFVMNARLRDIARDYFGPDICDDAESNQETKHLSVRELLRDGARVSLKLKK